MMQRIVLFAAAVGLAGLLLAAASIEPDPRGFGTHEQFGFPPCSFLTLAQIRCPACGMTTSWACLVRGRIAEAFAANVGGGMLGVLAILLVPLFLWTTATGRNETIRAYEKGILISLLIALATTLLDWAIRLAVP